MNKIFKIIIIILPIFAGIFLYQQIIPKAINQDATNNISIREILNNNLSLFSFNNDKHILNQSFLDKNKDKLIVINFWASWCSPCAKEIPILNAFKQKKLYEVEIIGIAIDNMDNIIKFNNKIPINYYLSIANVDGIELSKKIGNNLGVIPYTIFIKNNKIINSYTGELNQKYLEAQLSDIPSL